MSNFFVLTFPNYHVTTYFTQVQRDSKNGLNFVRLYFLNYTWYVNDLHNI
jgi:hypothetical protein